MKNQLATICVFALALWATGLSAQPLTEEFPLDGFAPSATSTGTLGNANAGTPAHLETEGSAWLHYARRPLVAKLRNPDGSTETNAIVQGRTTLDVGLAIGLFGSVALEARLPIILAQSGVGLGSFPASDRGEINSFALSDMRLQAKWRFARIGPLRTALGGTLWLPTGASDGFVSDRVVRGEPFVSIDAEIGDWLPAVSLGYEVRGEKVAHNYRSDDMLRWGVSTEWAVHELLRLQASVRGAHSFFRLPSTASDELVGNTLAHPIEALLGGALAFGPAHLVLAVGPALTRSVGAPKWRATAAIAYRGKPVPVERASETEPEREDKDGDGVDGLADLCPDATGLRDKHGCPASDADSDGIDDSDDRCPNNAEDVDDFEDVDGCPDLDNDRDGIADAADKCPLQPETVNDFEDSDGCPDELSDSSVRLKADRIEILESVYFDSDRATIKQRSFGILRQVAKVMNEHPEIQSLSVEGHTDSRGSAKHNLDLSTRRAQAVRAFLMNEGVDEGRLGASGFGESHPVDDNDTEKGRAENRRVEFLIAEKEGAQ